MDSDSDSDDSILKEITSGTTLDRKNPRNTKRSSAAARADKILDEALKFSTENLAQQVKISQIKREEVDTDELLKKTQQIKESGSKKHKVPSDDCTGNGDWNEDDARKRRKFLEKIADTELSSNLGARRTLFVSPGDSSDLPQTLCQALSYLHFLLQKWANQPELAKKYKYAILDPLERHLHEASLDFYLSDATLFDRCAFDGVKCIPNEFLEWLFYVSCAGGGDQFSPDLANLSDGAFRTLSAFWENGIVPLEGAIMALPELLVQLKNWYGFSLEMAKEAIDPSVQVLGVDTFNTGIKGFDSFLKLWELALDRGLVAVNEDNLEQDASDCVAALVFVGIDHVFNTHKYDLRIIEPFQKLVATILDLCYCTFGHDSGNGKIDCWMAKTAGMITTKLSKLGPGAPGTEDHDDGEAWLSSSLAIRLTNQPLFQKHASAKFAVHLALQFFKRALGYTEEEWSQYVQKLLHNLSLPNIAEGATIRWQALASSYFALSKVSKQTMCPENSAQILAIVDASHSCLNAGLSLFDERLFWEEADEDGFSDDEDSDELNVESCALHDIFAMFEAKMQDIENMSQKQALAAPHLRRVNFQVTCMRQYFRIEKSSFKSRQRESTVTQSTLHSFFPSKDQE